MYVQKLARNLGGFYTNFVLCTASPSKVTVSLSSGCGCPKPVPGLSELQDFLVLVVPHHAGIKLACSPKTVKNEKLTFVSYFFLSGYFTLESLCMCFSCAHLPRHSDPLPTRPYSCFVKVLVQ